jgi:putative ABC transport system substrate-binding protein
MRRREFIAALGATAAVWPLRARAQQADRVRRVGILMNLAEGDPEGHARRAALVQTLQELGWSVDRNLRIEHRWGAGDADRLRKNAIELVPLAPDIIVAEGSASLGPLQQVTRSIPIVFTIVPDPVGAGFVDSLSHPGGNATGISQFDTA